MTSQDKLSSYWKEADESMTEKEMMAVLIDSYTDLQQIKTAPDRDKEIDRQITVVKAKLEALGVVTENLDIH